MKSETGFRERLVVPVDLRDDPLALAALDLEPDRLPHHFDVLTPGETKAFPIGLWKRPALEMLFGHLDQLGRSFVFTRQGGP